MEKEMMLSVAKVKKKKNTEHNAVWKPRCIPNGSKRFVEQHRTVAH